MTIYHNLFKVIVEKNSSFTELPINDTLLSLSTFIVTLRYVLGGQVIMDECDGHALSQESFSLMYELFCDTSK